MSKHTPGPWKIDKVDGRFVYALNKQGTNSFHARISPGYAPGYDNEEKQIANARLIATAPYLLEEHIQWSEMFGKFIVELLQQNTLGIEQFITTAVVEYIDGKPRLKSGAITRATGKE